MRSGLVSAAVCVLAVALPACGGGPAPAADGGTDGGGGIDGHPDVAMVPADCSCGTDSTGALTLPWDCYCWQSYVGCDVPLAVPADCAGATRTDYPDCGLTVITSGTPGASLGLPSVYDATGKLVGRKSASDVSLYVCPSDPSLAGFTESAGQFPDPTCHGISCGGCYAGPFPCPGVDGGEVPEGGPFRFDAGHTPSPDATIDAPTDAAIDAPIDAGVDALIDAASDAAVDAPVDAVVDAAIDAPIDAPLESIPDAPFDAVGD